MNDLKEPVQWQTAIANTVEVITLAPNQVTSSGRSLSVLFDNLKADVQLPEACGSIVKIASLEVPIQLLSEGGFVGYIVAVRGYATKSEGVRACLLCEFGGANAQLQLPYGTTHDGELFLQVFSMDLRSGTGSGQSRLPLTPFTLNMLLSVQRRTTEDQALVVIDSVDVQAVESI